MATPSEVPCVISTSAGSTLNSCAASVRASSSTADANALPSGPAGPPALSRSPASRIRSTTCDGLGPAQPAFM